MSIDVSTRLSVDQLFLSTLADSVVESDYTVAEYFAGIGLVRLGLERAGWRVLYANDFNVEKYEMYSAYFADAETHYEIKDIFDLNISNIPKTFLATCSFPCIDLSLAGNQKGINGKHSSAFWGFRDILRKQGKNKPPMVLLENVPGWLTSNDGEDFRVTISALNELGYACDVYSIDALGFTPQSRLRVFVVGVQTKNPNQAIQTLQSRPTYLAIDSLKDAVRKYQNLSWHILNVPTPPYEQVKELDKIIEKIPFFDSRWWDQEKVDRHLQMMAPSHLDRVIKMSKSTKVVYRTVFRRRREGIQRAEVRNDNTAGCLRTARGGSSRQIVLQAGNGKIRMRHMTPREYARLQGVPDDYPTPANTIQALTGFGDAVCVPVITWIAQNILNPLAITINR